MEGVIQFVKSNALVLALVAIALFQQSEIKEMERTLNYIFSGVQANNNEINAVKEEVWAVSDLVIAIYDEEAPQADQ